MNKILNKDGTELIQENYKAYAKYVCETRAYPDIIDGTKSIHRRIIYGIDKGCKKGIVKSPELIAATVIYHPHPTSIYPVIVSMASPYDCPFPLFDIEGNFGGNGFPPAAERYTSANLSDLALSIFEPFSDYVDMVEGEMDKEEPEHLATLLPLCFLHGSYGIPVGLSTVNIPALSPNDLIKYYIDVLKSKDYRTESSVLVRPNIGNVKVVSDQEDWETLLKKGGGTIKVAPNIILDKKLNKLEIIGLPSGKSVTHVMAILSNELTKDQINFRDESTIGTKYIVEVLPYKKVDIEEIYERLVKKLTVSQSFKFIFAEKGISVFCGFQNVIKRNLEYTIKCCGRKLKHEIDVLQFKLKVLEVIELMKKDGNLIKLVKMTQNEAIEFIKTTYSVVEEQAKSVLGKPISYLTKEHRPEIDALYKDLEITNNRNDDVYAYLTELYTDLQLRVKEFTRGKDQTVFVKEEAKKKARKERREIRKKRVKENAG